MLIKKNNFFIFIISVLIPLTNVLESNLKSRSIGITDLLFVFFVLIFIYLIIYYSIKFLTKNYFKNNFDKIFIITSCLFYFIFFYGVISKIFYKFFPLLILDKFFVEILIFIIWSSLLIVLYNFLLFIYNKNLKLTISIIFTLILIINIISISKFYFFENKVFNNQQFNEKSIDIYSDDKFKQLTFNNFPNVYFIIFDSYTSKEYVNFLYPEDDYKINEFLKQKKFIITKNKLSHYNSTQKSVPVILNSNYFSDKYWLSEINWNSIRMQSLDDSSIKQIFENNDYKINSLFCSSDYYQQKKFCENISDLSYIEKFDFNFITAVFHNTPFKYLVRKFLHIVNDSYKIYLENFSDIINIVNLEANIKPMFNFIHFGIPHPPYMFDENCNFKNISNDKIVNNNFLIDDPVFLKDGYYDNFLCATNVSKQIIRNILEYDEKPYIVLLSDHGPNIRRDLTPNKIDYDDIMDKHSAHMSLFVDDKCKKNINLNDISHVNIFRIVTNCLSSEKNITLPFSLYYNDYWQRNGKFEILTEENLSKIKNKTN